MATHFWVAVWIIVLDVFFWGLFFFIFSFFIRRYHLTVNRASWKVLEFRLSSAISASLLLIIVAERASFKAGFSSWGLDRLLYKVHLLDDLLTVQALSEIDFFWVSWGNRILSLNHLSFNILQFFSKFHSIFFRLWRWLFCFEDMGVSIPENTLILARRFRLNHNYRHFICIRFVCLLLFKLFIDLNHFLSYEMSSIHWRFPSSIVSSLPSYSAS